MPALKRLLREVARRNLLGTLGIFVGAGWGVLQVMDLFIERGFLPEWTFDGALLALVLGLPVVLATAYIQGGRRVAREDDSVVLSDTEDDLADVLTWHRAILGGVLAFALLGVVATGYMVLRVTGLGAPGTLAAQGTFEIGGRVVIADFESSAGSAAPGDLITESLRIDLAQSDAFAIVDRAEVADTRRLMLADPTEPLLEPEARELATRLGVAGVISGEVGRVGSSYVLTSRLIDAETGTVLAPFRHTARDSTRLLDAIDDLAADMRAKVGESLRSVAGRESLRAVTTSSLEALRKYTYVSSRISRGAIDRDVAQQLLEEAIALDSTFAAANLALSISISNSGGSVERAWQAASQAYRHRGRLSERERLQVEASYFVKAGDERAAIQAYRRMLALDSTSTAAATNLADLSMYAGEYQEAADLLMTRHDPGSVASAFNLMASLTALGRVDDAMAAVDTFAALSPEAYDPHLWRVLVLTASERIDDARASLESAPPPPAVYLAWMSYGGAAVDALSGSLDSSREKLSGAQSYAERFGTPTDQLYLAVAAGWVSAWVERDRRAVAETMDRVAAEIDVELSSIRDRRYPERALVHAMLGDASRVAELIEAYRAGVDVDTDAEGRAYAAVAEALVAVRPDDDASFERLERALPALRCARCRDVLLGHGAEVAGRSGEAIAAYERFLQYPFFDGPTILTHFLSTNVHERLGPLYEEAGDPVAAVEHYSAFAEAWRRADARLQPRVERARARITALEGA